MKHLFFAALTLSAATLFSADPTFVRHDVGSLLGASDFCIVDVNNDNHQDIVATGYNEGIFWFKNDGNQNFLKNQIADTTKHKDARTVRATLHDGTKVDFNNDGFADLVTASMKRNRVSVWTNSGNGQFAETVIDTLSPGAHTVDLADLDKDGDIDILIAAMGNSSGIGQLAIYYNNGSTQFNKMILESSQSFQAFIYTADLNNDGVNEILFTEYGTGKLGYFKKNGSDYEKIIIGTLNGMHTALAKDYDNDGDLDVLSANYASVNDSRFIVWNNDGSGNFTQAWSYAAMGSIWLDMADFDNDGDNDLVGAAQNPGVSQDLYWFKSNGSNNFTAFPLVANLSEVHCAKPADLDNDGDIDIILAANFSNINPGDKIIWWENKFITGIEEQVKDKDTGLLDNYPNPFNPSTTITYEMQTANHAKLSIYNGKGELIKTLIDSLQNAGHQSVNFDGGELESGIYFCQLITDGKAVNRKLLLVK